MVLRKTFMDWKEGRMGAGINKFSISGMEWWGEGRVLKEV